MRNIYNIFLVSILVSAFGFAIGQNQTTINQNQKADNTKLVKQQKTITSFEKKQAETETIFSAQATSGISEFSMSKEAEINWQFTDPVGILFNTETNGTTQKTLGAWELNDKRISLYGNNSTPEWEYVVNSEWSYPVDMTPDGQYIAYGADDEIDQLEIITNYGS